MHWAGLCLPATALLSWHFCSIFGGGLIPELSPSLNFKLPESKDFPTPLPPPPTASGISTCAAQVYPTLAALPARFQPQWPSPRAQLGSPPPPRPGADTRPAPPGFAPLLARRAAHLHRGLPVSPAPTPPRPVPAEALGPRYCRQVKHEDNTSTPQRQSKLSMI